MGWCAGTCPYRTKGCQIAGQIAKLPVSQTVPTDDQCDYCKELSEPSPEQPNAVVALLALEAVQREQPTRAKHLRERLGQVIPAPPSVERVYSEADFPCRHRGALRRQAECTSCGSKGAVHNVYACDLLKRECTVLASVIPDHIDGKNVEICLGCDYRQDGPPVKVEYHPRKIHYIRTPSGRYCGECWENRYAGQTVFLVCGGPSLKQTPLELLQQRGVITGAINNAAAVVRPAFAFMVDSPSRFHHSIFSDPQIATFVKSDKIHRHTRIEIGRKPNGTPLFEKTAKASEFPNVWMYERSTDEPFTPQTFLSSRLPVWANGGHRTTMLIAMRMLIDMGFTTINLVGCDFRMTLESAYGFDERKDASGVASNNNLYEWLKGQFVVLRPILENAGITVRNCTVGGELEAFNRVPLEQAVAEALKGIPPVGSLYGYYSGKRQ